MRIYTLQVGEIGTNCYLAASDAGNAAIVDPGAEPERIAAALERHSLTPRLILLTHGHFDHIGAAEALRQRYHIPLYVHAADAELLSDPAKNGGKGLMRREVTAGYDHLLVDGDRIPLDELEFQIVHTPGHTKGSVCFAAEDALLAGDTLFCRGIGRTDLYGGSFPEIRRSLSRLAALEGDRRVFPGHGPATTLDAERAENPYLGERL